MDREGRVLLAARGVQFRWIRPEIADVMKRDAFLVGAGPWGLKTLPQVPEHTDVIIEEVGGDVVPVTGKQV